MEIVYSGYSMAPTIYQLFFVCCFLSKIAGYFKFGSGQNKPTKPCGNWLKPIISKGILLCGLPTIYYSKRSLIIEL